MPFSFGLSRRTARLIFLLRAWANRTRGKHKGNFLIDKAVMRVMQTYKCICFLSWRAWTIKILTLLPLISSSVHAADLRPGDIVTVLPKDAIPAIMSPSFDDGNKASWLRGTDPVVGIEIAGESRAYPVAILSRHEIVNDKIGVIPFAVTW